MEEIERIEQAVKGRQIKKRDKFVSIGQAAEQFIAGQVIPQQKRYGDVIEVWQQAIPEELGKHCEIIEISGGSLTIQVDSPSYKYELHLCSPAILKELQKECPRAKLTKIKLL